MCLFTALEHWLRHTDITTCRTYSRTQHSPRKYCIDPCDLALLALLGSSAVYLKNFTPHSPPCHLPPYTMPVINPDSHLISLIRALLFCICSSSGSCAVSFRVITADFYSAVFSTARSPLQALGRKQSVPLGWLSTSLFGEVHSPGFWLLPCSFFSFIRFLKVRFSH